MKSNSIKLVPTEVYDLSVANSKNLLLPLERVFQIFCNTEGKKKKQTKKQTNPEDNSKIIVTRSSVSVSLPVLTKRFFSLKLFLTGMPLSLAVPQADAVN